MPSTCLYASLLSPITSWFLKIRGFAWNPTATIKLFLRQTIFSDNILLYHMIMYIFLDYKIIIVLTIFKLPFWPLQLTAFNNITVTAAIPGWCFAGIEIWGQSSFFFENLTLSFMSFSLNCIRLMILGIYRLSFEVLDEEDSFENPVTVDDTQVFYIRLWDSVFACVVCYL
mgnify:CR=1 FL=1